MIYRVFVILLLCMSFVFAAKFDPKAKKINGVDVYYLYDDYLPIISLNLAIKNAGFAFEEEGQIGSNLIVNYLASNLLFLGNEREYFSKEISSRNISFQVASDVENLFISVKFLRSDIELVQKFLKKFFYDFKVSDADIKRAKDHLEFSKKNSYLNSNFVGYQNFKDSFFTDRFSRDGFLVENNNLINKASIKYFVSSLANKNKLKIAISGDIKTDELDVFVNQIFADFKDIESYDFYQPGIKNAYNANFELKDYDQIIFYSAIEGPSRNAKDFYSFYLWNHLIGGSQRNSLIGNKLREDEGLTYSGYSYVNFMQGIGYLVVYFACDMEKYYQALEVNEKMLAEIKRKEFSQQDLELAKKYLTGKYDISFSSNDTISGFMLALLLYDLPVSMLNKRNEIINEITIADINKMRKKLFFNNDFVTFVTGDLY